MIPRGIRNNNPGNLDYVGQAGAHLETGVTHPRFAAFPTMADGIRALRDQLIRYGVRGLDTVSKIVSAYAPASENATAAYIEFVCTVLGVCPDRVLDMDDPSLQSRLIYAISGMENGPGRLPLSQIEQTLQSAPTTAVA